MKKSEEDSKILVFHFHFVKQKITHLLTQLTVPSRTRC